jgi:hypothetical protein
MHLDHSLSIQDAPPTRHSVELYPMRYIPVPPNGKVCPVTGLKHAYLYRLLRHGEAARHVRIAHLKEPGCSRGRMLFHAGDMLRWLDQKAMARNVDAEHNAAPSTAIEDRKAAREGAGTS